MSQPKQVKHIETGKLYDVISMYENVVSSRGNKMGYQYTTEFARADMIVVDDGPDFPQIRQFKQEDVTLP